METDFETQQLNYMLGHLEYGKSKRQNTLLDLLQRVSDTDIGSSFKLYTMLHDTCM